jgi:hypothetical protein
MKLKIYDTLNEFRKTDYLYSFLTKGSNVILTEGWYNEINLFYR